MKVNTEGTSRKSLIRTGKVELLEFFAQRRACDDQDRGMACSVARALVRGARNALLTVTPLWLARSLGGWQGESSPQLKTRRARERPSRRICSARVRTRPPDGDGTRHSTILVVAGAPLRKEFQQFDLAGAYQGFPRCAFRIYLHNAPCSRMYS
ncbi:MAG: hypothetical protein DMG79_14020 [Acidobacteria bacterium]|nr:MAG: hypothetical protein DMG79_14020 [Acidobacteriota bacterium]